MEKSLAVSILLFTVVIISEISCEYTHCLQFQRKCFEDSECCSSNCVHTENPNRSYCMNPKNSTLYDPKIEEGFCSYDKSFYKNQSQATYERFGISAAHALLPPFTKVQIRYNNKTLDVVINDLPNKSNDTLLVLSREAAMMLDIEQEGLVPCSIGIYEEEPNYLSIKKILTVTASFFVVVFFLFKFL